MNRPQLGDEAASYVRDLIMSGALRSGQFIRPEAVAETLGISATPVREGLLALRADGFVQLEPRRGFVVSPLSSQDVRDLFAAQALLAGELAARTAQKITEADLAGLEELQTDIEKAAKRKDLDRLEDLNFHFHRRINLLAAAPKITLLIGFAVRCVPYRSYSAISGWPNSTVEDHRAVLAALRKGSAAKARSAMAHHITNAGELLATHFEGMKPDGQGVSDAVHPLTRSNGKSA
jgi:DNA-binding GntR family transcriptional regulator